jgi:hypothetical protein
MPLLLSTVHLKRKKWPMFEYKDSLAVGLVGKIGRENLRPSTKICG